MSKRTLPRIICTKFGIDSSSHFPFTAWTYTNTQRKSDTTDHWILCLGYL